MIRRFTTNKDYLLTALSILLLVIGYELAFQKTILLWKENRRLKALVAGSAGLNYQPGYLIRKDNNLNHILELYRADTALIRNEMINTVSLVAEKNNARLADVPADNPDLHQPRFRIQELSIEGDFFSLIRILHDLQNLKNIGLVRSADIRIKPEKTETLKGKKLIMDVYLEIIN